MMHKKPNNCNIQN